MPDTEKQRHVPFHNPTAAAFPGNLPDIRQRFRISAYQGSGNPLHQPVLHIAYQCMYFPIIDPFQNKKAQPSMMEQLRP